MWSVHPPKRLLQISIIGDERVRPPIRFLRDTPTAVSPNFGKMLVFVAGLRKGRGEREEGEEGREEGKGKEGGRKEGRERRRKKPKKLVQGKALHVAL